MSNTDSFLIHVIDFEGTPESGIWEYGVVTIEHTQIKNTQTGLCSPEDTPPQTALQLCNLDPNELAQHPSFKDHWGRFNGLRKQGAFAAHHASVEDRLIRTYFPYPSESLNFATHTECVSWGPWIDTLPLYQTYYPGLNSYKVTELIDTFQLSSKLEAAVNHHCPAARNKPHCALYDSLAAALLIIHLKEEGLPLYKVAPQNQTELQF